MKKSSLTIVLLIGIVTVSSFTIKSAENKPAEGEEPFDPYMPPPPPILGPVAEKEKPHDILSLGRALTAKNYQFIEKQGPQAVDFLLKKNFTQKTLLSETILKEMKEAGYIAKKEIRPPVHTPITTPQPTSCSITSDPNTIEGKLEGLTCALTMIKQTPEKIDLGDKKDPILDVKIANIPPFKAELSNKPGDQVASVNEHMGDKKTAKPFNALVYKKLAKLIGSEQIFRDWLITEGYMTA